MDSQRSVILTNEETRSAAALLKVEAYKDKDAFDELTILMFGRVHSTLKQLSKQVKLVFRDGEYLSFRSIKIYTTSDLQNFDDLDCYISSTRTPKADFVVGILDASKSDEIHYAKSQLKKLHHRFFDGKFFLVSVIDEALPTITTAHTSLIQEINELPQAKFATIISLQSKSEEEINTTAIRIVNAAAENCMGSMEVAFDATSS